jgi:hypothetical protein
MSCFVCLCICYAADVVINIYVHLFDLFMNTVNGCVRHSCTAINLFLLFTYHDAAILIGSTSNSELLTVGVI